MKKVSKSVLVILFVLSQQAFSQKTHDTITAHAHLQSDSIKWKIHDALVDYYRPIIFDTINCPNLLELEKVAVKNFGEVGQQVIWSEFALYYYLKKDFSRWMGLKVKLYQRHADLIDYRILNNDAWYVFEKASDKQNLLVALSWSKRVIEKEPTANYYDTFANILYKLGRTEEAIQTEERGLLLPVGNGFVEDIRENLRKMKSGERTW